MAAGKKILGISGSTRRNSSNGQLLKAIAVLYIDQMEMLVFDGIGTLPPFNPDDIDTGIAAVTAFRQQVHEADGVIICTPEYAHGVPGALKNAIDWTVTSNEFSQKPVALITASSDGRMGHAALLETLRTIEAKNVDRQQLIIPFIKTKINKDNVITDEATLIAVKTIINELLATTEKQ